ncbi:hypothetical protein MWN34_00595 [Ancylobacter sp. 6x-1]|uniref:Lipoprotein n=1 Tax=Ancylobacter crimeensis TaxID=2579147 RepID=A0ABT0D632_9HYPH|nr:hypothetical protein [Ancylobacter crimeensis]MCK0195403.1 hypothetical protein [Ancylobacter crimeensis]
MPNRHVVRRLALACVLISLSGALAGCESMDALNPFATKQKKLPGTRVPVFPEGVPGVDYNAPPPQPANSAIPDPAMSPAPDTSAGGAAPRGAVTTQ